MVTLGESLGISAPLPFPQRSWVPAAQALQLFVGEALLPLSPQTAGLLWDG